MNLELLARLEDEILDWPGVWKDARGWPRRERWSLTRADFRGGFPSVVSYERAKAAEKSRAARLDELEERKTSWKP